MDDGGASLDTSEEGSTPAPSLEEKGNQSAGEETGGHKRGASGGTDASGVGREDDAVVAPAAKKRKTLGRGMEDPGHEMEDRILEEEAPASAKNKRKHTIAPTEEVGGKKAKTGRRGSEADGSGGPGHNSKLDKEEYNRKAKNRFRKKKDRGSRRKGSASGAPNEDPERKPLHAPRIVVACTPNIPSRYGYLIGLITNLLPCKNKGKAYECCLNRIQTFIKWSRCNQCMFFEWLNKDREMICWMFNTIKRSCVKFLINPAFATEMLEVKVKRAVCAFSLNFFSDESWTGIKESLEMMFCPQDKSLSDDAPDFLYVFTRIGDHVYFRNMKIEKLPDTAHGEELVLKEVGPYLCLKLMGIHGDSDVSNLAPDVSHNQNEKELSMSRIPYYSLSPELGSRMSVHAFYLGGKKNLFLLESGQDLSSFEGYNINLQEFLEEQSFLKKKYIVGSKSGETCLFARNIAKSIIRSILGYFIELFLGHKCIKMTRLEFRQILLKKSLVQLYGVEFVDYAEDLAKQNVDIVVVLIRQCFPEQLIPCDLKEMLDDLMEDPLDNLDTARDDSSLLSAKERRDLLVLLHTEYMTNVKPKLCPVQQNIFFKDCPYLDTWFETMRRNTYLNDVGNYNALLGNLKLEKRKEEEKKKRKREERKEMENEDEEEKVEDGGKGQKAEVQFHVMRNCDVHVSEAAVKSGITPFRLSWTDYIRTFYFPMYLPFIQRKMVQYKKTVSDEVTTDKDGVTRREEEQEIVRAITSGQLSMNSRQRQEL